jgi:hypothetical protein
LTSSTGNDGTGDPTVQAMSRAEILSVVAFCLAATLFYGIVVWFGPVGRGEYQFPDAYMHLVRAAELWDGGGWYNHEIARGNAPYGEILHWTRPFDLILLAPAALLRPFLEARDALFWAGALLAPFLTVVTCLAAAWAIGPLVGAARLWVLPILFLQWPVLGYGFPGRADHHIVILLLLVLVLGLLFRARSRPDQARSRPGTLAAPGRSVPWARPVGRGGVRDRPGDQPGLPVALLGLGAGPGGGPSAGPGQPAVRAGTAGRHPGRGGGRAPAG